ncbi:MAG TPA: alkaline phosphatase PhoX [Blastocatellia bacterium]|nr:alkaline phosphatase PhoX [Blastocatellia bacterium]
MKFKLTLSVIAISILVAINAPARNSVLTSVSNANPRSGHPDTQLAKGFELVKIAEGSDPIENPSGVITNFGLLNDFPPQAIERTRTEPDENTYIVFDSNPGGPAPDFDYGRHFLYQGHENANNLAYITRINLDVEDPLHRITLLTPTNAAGKTGFNSIDGSTWDPFTRTLLFAQEAGFPTGGVIEVTPDWPPTATRMDGIIGSSSYEGVHPDKNGNILLVEDSGGTSVNVIRGDSTSPVAARQPNSFIYLFVPNDRHNLSKGGRLLAMQVQIGRKPLTFHSNDAVGDVFADEQLKLYSPGTLWPFGWVTLHDTDVDGTAPFNANALAKAFGATPFKRPENAAFQPGSDFTTFFFTATGDTNANSGNQPELAARGAWGAIFRVDLTSPRLSGGFISLAFLGDRDHAAFDNLAFADPDTLIVAEDRGDTLHRQLNILDSAWAYTVPSSRVGQSPARRLIALGRDTESEVDAGLLDAGTSGFQNDGDNEVTGVHVSDGANSTDRLVGNILNVVETRWFFTQQHGKNTVYQIIQTSKVP